MRRASVVVCATIIELGGLLANQALAQMVRYVDGHGPEALVPPEYRNQAQQPQLPEPTVQGTMPALSSKLGSAAQQPTAEDQAKQALGRRIQEARQRQCNTEWEQFHQAKAEFCKPPARGIGEARCPLDILGYEPSALCK